MKAFPPYKSRLKDFHGNFIKLKASFSCKIWTGKIRIKEDQQKLYTGGLLAWCTTAVSPISFNERQWKFMSMKSYTKKNFTPMRTFNAFPCFCAISIQLVFLTTLLVTWNLLGLQYLNSRFRSFQLFHIDSDEASTNLIKSRQFI